MDGADSPTPPARQEIVSRRDMRRPTGPHYWDEQRMTDHLRQAGFELVALRRTFFDDASLLASVRKPNAAAGLSPKRSAS